MMVFIVIVLILIIYIIFENKNLGISHYEVNQQAVPEAFEGTRIVCLSDLHNNSFGKKNRRLLQEIMRFEPSYVVLAGDMVTSDKKGKYQNCLNLLLELSKHYPVYYALGNHESRLFLKEPAEEGFKAYCGILKKAGVVFLDNSSVVIKKGEASLYLHGLTLPLGYYGRYKTTSHPPVGELTELLGKAVKDSEREHTYHVLLAHMPVYFKEYAQWGADLILSGHMHGGIMILPYFGGVISPQYQWFPEYDWGRFSYHESVMLLSRGLGTHSIPVRFLNRPELLCITLRK